jgi:hypothetical protein
MFSARRIVIGVPLLVISGIASQVIFSSKTTGDLVAAHWDSGLVGIVDVIPADTPDGSAYSVFWRGCTLNPDFDHRFCTFAGGLAPKSAVKTQQVDKLGLNLDISMLSVIFTTGGEDCRSGTCIMFVPLSVPLDGTFTIYRGPGSFLEQSNGSTRRDDLLPFGGITTSRAFLGNRARYSANFAGAVGPVTVSPGPIGSNASLTIMKGQQSFQTVYTVYPPTP